MPSMSWDEFLVPRSNVDHADGDKQKILYQRPIIVITKVSLVQLRHAFVTQFRQSMSFPSGSLVTTHDIKCFTMTKNTLNLHNQQNSEPR
jgi:hypothetical protein